jgi:GDP-D-mannose 3',5'-epimerase
MKTALVCGAGGFIGTHLVEKLKGEGFWVRGADLKRPLFSETAADDFIVGDLTDPVIVAAVIDRPFDEVYQLAADMGGAGYIFTGEHDADVMHNSATINLNVARQAVESKVKKVFYSSSACIYPERNQLDPDNPNCAEDSAYPAEPDSEYGWEKLFSERMFLAYNRNYGLNVRIARFHNIFGPLGTWDGGKEKAPAAMCRKVAEAIDGGEIEIWGDGKQTRTFLYVDECLEGVRRLMDSEFTGPVNIGSDEMVSINQLAEMVMNVAGKKLKIKHIEGPLGVRGRSSDNRLIKEKLGWQPQEKLENGIRKSFAWINIQVEEKMKKFPKISIITPTYNQANYIERTIKSILDQDYPNIEYIVMDGGSKDGTVEILKKYSDRIIWKSEKDKGQADAINKGLKIATGDICAYINSDDVYEPGAFKKVAAFFTDNPSMRWVYGKCRIINEDDQEIRKFVTWYKNISLANYSYKKLLVENFISQPATFWKRDLHKELGLFDENEYHVMDYEFWLRVGSKYPAGVIKDYVSNFRFYSNSKSGLQTRERFQDELRVARAYSKGNRIINILHKLNYFKIVGAYKIMAVFNR